MWIKYVFMLALFANVSQARELPIRMPIAKHCSGYDLFEALQLNDTHCLNAAIGAMAVEETNQRGDTALHEAIRLKNGPAILWLIKSGSDLRQKNFDEQTPVQLAEALGYGRLADYLSNRVLETDRLVDAIDFREIRKVKFSLRRGASLGTRDTRLDTPLHKAAQSNFNDIGALLIAAGAALEARNYLGETALHSAAIRGHLEMMRMLLRAGARVNAITERRETALDLVSHDENSAARKLLLQYGAKSGSRVDATMGFVSGE